MPFLNLVENDDMYYERAKFAIEKGLVIGNPNIDSLAKMLKKIDIEKKEKEQISDSIINYNDEILSIEYIGDKETIDISVTGDNLFYCNNILTKNSWGLPSTSDWMGAIIQSPELFEQRKYIFKNLKSRYNSNINQVVTLGVDYDKMRLINLAEDQQEIPIHVKDALKRKQQEVEEKQLYEDLDFT